MEGNETMSCSSSKLCWTDPPPFEKHCYEYQKFIHTESVGERDVEQLVEEINSQGKELFKGNKFIDALWKYENCVLLCAKYKLSNRLRARALSNCSLALLKVMKTSSTLSEPEKTYCLEHLRDQCDQSLELREKKFLPKAHYTKAEALRLQASTQSLKSAMVHYMKSFEEDKNMDAMLMAIVVGVNNRQTQELQQIQEYITGHPSLLNDLLEMVAQSPLIERIHVKFLFIGDKDCAGFLCDAVCAPTHTIEWKMVQKVLNKCFKLKPSQRSRVVKLFVPDESTLKSVNDRTKDLLDMIQTYHFSQAVETIDSGKIFAHRINLSDQIDHLLRRNGKQLLQKLLTAGVDPEGLGQSTDDSPMKILCKKCGNPKTKSGRHLQNKIVTYMQILLKEGADVLNLNVTTGYSHGHESRNSPLYSATHLALATGNTEFLDLVDKGNPLSWVPDEEERKTSLTIAQASDSRSRDKVIEFFMSKITKCPQEGDIPSEIQEKPTMKTKTAAETPTCADRPPNEMLTQIEMDTTSKTTVLETNGVTDTDPELTEERNGDVVSTILQHSQETSEPDKIDTAEPEPKSRKTRPIETPIIYEQPISKQDLQTTVEELLQKPDSYFSFPLQGVPSLEAKLPEATESADSDFLDNGKVVLQEPSEQKKVQTEAATLTLKTEETDINFENEPWEVEIHENVAHFIKDKAQLFKIRQQVIKKLRKLASGNWNEKLHKRLTDEKNTVIYEAKLTKAARILYQITVRFSERESNKLANIKTETDDPIHVYSQKIVVWEIVLNHDRINHSAQRIKKAIQSLKLPTPLQPVLLHEEFKQSAIQPQLYLDCSKLNPKEINTIQQNLRSELINETTREYDVGVKMYSVTTQLALGLLDEEHDRRDYPIKVTDEEHDIIKVPNSEPVLVLGRSGTGKTTTCLCRLWLQFKNYWSVPDRKNKPIFPKPQHVVNLDDTYTSVTFTDDSKSEDKSLLGDLSETGPFEESTESEERNTDMPIFQSEANDCEHLHQIFITKNYGLCAKMKKRFYDFVAGHEATKEHLEYENEKVPNTFSEVQNFPLFLTARQFFIMLDKSLDDHREYFKSGDKIDRLHEGDDQSNSNALHLLLEISESESEDESDDERKKRKRKHQPKTEVTASYFKMYLWHHISKHCSDPKIDPLLIWTEIKSFIKGSKQALDCKAGFVTKDMYLEIGKKQAPNFPLHRDEVYKLFEEYNKLKHKDCRKHHFDSCDFIWKLNERLEVIGSQNIPWSIHHIYIDEVQDFTQAELSVILKCCRDPNRSFLAGDTAQTIMKGITFRFEDLKSLFHKLKSAPNCVTKVPKLKKLTTNHRSHSAITELATSITDLLEEFFPYSFDWKTIPKDRSNLRGPKPLFICSRHQLDNFLLLQGRQESLSSIEFGADQVVIVRDSSEEGKAKLPEYLREGIVLNIQECKGLEFNHVLIFNFFTDCHEQQHEMWKTSATYLKRHPDLEEQTAIHTEVHPLEFNESHHKSLGVELKSLYTVITRSKCHVWIYEDLEPENLPMLEYWHKRNMIKVVYHDDQVFLSEDDLLTVSDLKISSTEDWKKRGNTFAAQGNWKAAKTCYHNAKERVLETKAHAHSLLKTASNTKHVLLMSAAALFIECDRLSHKKEYLQHAASCLFHAKMYHESIQLFEKLQKYRHASSICKKHTKNDVETLSRLKEKMGNYRGAIKVYLDRRRFEPALRLAHKYVSEGHLDLEVAPYDSITTAAYSEIKKCLRLKDYEKLTRYVKVIPDVYEQVHFLKKGNLYKDACEVLLANKMLEEAFRIYSAQGWHSGAIEVARNLEDWDVIRTFTIQKAVEHLANRKSVFEQDTKKELESMKALKNSKVKAKACFLLAMETLYEESDIDEAQKLCTQAWNTYKNESKNQAGEIETFHLLCKIREKKGEYTVQHASMTIDTISKAEELCYLLKKGLASLNIVAIAHIEEFYGLTKQGSDIYCLPRGQDLCIKLSQQKGTRVDHDGMLQIERQKTLKCIHDHYRSYIDNWKDGLKAMKEPWQTRVKLSFPFHTEVTSEPYLKKAHRAFPPKQIDEYLSMCRLALQVNRLNPEVYQERDLLIPLQRLLSPFSQLSLPFQKSNYLSISETETFQSMFLERISGQVLQTATYISEPPNIDRWLQAWRFLSIMGSKSVIKLNHAIHSQNMEVNEKAKREWYDPSREPPYSYVYVKHNNCHENIFTMWIWSCKLFREGNKTLVATKMSFRQFVQVVVRRRSLYRTLSIENLVNILSIQSTALLAMISSSRFILKFPQITMVMPESFDLMVNTFDLLNCDRRDPNHIRLLPACLNTSQKVNQRTVVNVSVDLLKDIIRVLIGEYNRYYCPLKNAFGDLNQIISGEAGHCLVLILTIFGNLIACSQLNVAECQFYCSSVLRDLGSVFTFQTHKNVKSLQEAYFNLAFCSNTKDLFIKVINPLLAASDQKMVELKTVTSLGKQQIRVKACSFHQIPNVPFKWPMYQIPSHISWKQPFPTKSSQTELPPSQQKVPSPNSPPDQAEGVSTLTKGKVSPNVQCEKRQSEMEISSTNNEAYVKTSEQLQVEQNLEQIQRPLLIDNEEVTESSGEETVSEPSRDQHNASRNDEYYEESKSTDSDISEDEVDTDDEDVLKEISAAVEAEYEPEPEPQVDTILEREKKDFFDGSHCIICNVELEGDDQCANHFKSEAHLKTKKQYNRYRLTDMTYGFTQKHLKYTIQKSQQVEHSDYDLEKMTINAERFVRTNNEQATEIQQTCDWEMGLKKLEELRDYTSTIIKELDEQIKLTQDREKNLLPENTEENENESEEDDDDMIDFFGKVKHRSKKGKRRKE